MAVGRLLINNKMDPSTVKNAVAIFTILSNKTMAISNAAQFGRNRSWSADDEPSGVVKDEERWQQFDNWWIKAQNHFIKVTKHNFYIYYYFSHKNSPAYWQKNNAFVFELKSSSASFECWCNRDFGHIAGFGPRPSNLVILRSPVTATASSRLRHVIRTSTNP